MIGGRPRPLVLLRPVPGASPVHRLWAGTKLAVVGMIAVLLAVFPGWPSLILVGMLAVVGAGVAGVPYGALPSLPRWLWAILLCGAVVGAAAGGAPDIAVGQVEFGFGGLLTYLQLVLFAVVMMAVCALVSWTTHVAEIAPAIATLGGPLRRLGMPIDDWAVTLALALRAFPLLLQEFRVLNAARSLRPARPQSAGWPHVGRWPTGVLDLLATALTAAMRRADEMGDAITARGGAGQISALQAKPGRADAVAVVIVVGVSGLAVALHIWTF